MGENKLELSQEIESLKQNLSQLDLRIKDKEKPWYREASIVVATLALLFSFGTTLVSYVKSSQQEVLASRVELRELIKDITNIPKEHAEMLLKYKNDPLTFSQLSAQINSKNLSLSNQAAAIIGRIESSWYGKDSILDIEFMTVGTSLFSSFQVEKSKPLFIEAYSRSKDVTTAASALRSLAGVHLTYRDTTLMRDSFKMAIDIFNHEKYADEPDTTKYVTNVTTEIQWAFAELQLGDCKNAFLHLNNAFPILQLIPESPIKLQLNSQANKIKISMNQKCES